MATPSIAKEEDKRTTNRPKPIKFSLTIFELLLLRLLQATRRETDGGGRMSQGLVFLSPRNAFHFDMAVSGIVAVVGVMGWILPSSVDYPNMKK